MPYNDLRKFLAKLEQLDELKHIDQPLSPFLEITEVCQRTLRQGGPALLFEKPAGYSTPLLGNLFGTLQRVMTAMNVTDTSGLREIGKLLGFLREPQWPSSVGDAIEHLPYFQRLLHVTPRLLRYGVCQEEIIEGKKVDLSSLPIQTCWPGDAGPLITWGLVITKGPRQKRCNIGIYRQQVIDRNKVIMRWLPHRGGAIDFQEWQHAYPGQRFPLNVAIGSDPAMLLAAATPIPDTLSEFQFAGLLRGSRTELIHSKQTGLPAPANAEYLLEGHIEPGETALEGPFGDHTGYYNSVDRFPVFTIDRICHRSNPIYHSTYMGRSPYDEPSVLAMALNEMYIPVLQRTFPEIVDFYLPPAACSYRIAIISIRKQYAGHSQRIMFSVWSFLRQFTYTKLVIITDDDIDVRDWQAVMWAVSTRADPGRDILIVENTPIDYLDFASPVAGLGGKLGIDATNKLHGETNRHWGSPIKMDEDVVKRVDELWKEIWPIKSE